MMPADRRQGHVHDRGIDHIEELHRAQAAAAACRGGWRRQSGLDGHRHSLQDSTISTVLRLSSKWTIVPCSARTQVRTCASPVSTAMRSDAHVLAGLAEHHPALDAGQQPRGQNGGPGVRAQLPALAHPLQRASQQPLPGVDPATACSRASSLAATSVPSVPIGHPGMPASSNPATSPASACSSPASDDTPPRTSVRPATTCAQRYPTAAAASSSGCRSSHKADPARPGSSERLVHAGARDPPARRTAQRPAPRSAPGWRARAWSSAHPAWAHASRGLYQVVQDAAAHAEGTLSQDGAPA